MLHLKQKPASDHVDIITFYNEVFIPAVKSLLVELGPAATNSRANRGPEVNSNNDGMPFFLYCVCVTVFCLYALLVSYFDSSKKLFSLKLLA